MSEQHRRELVVLVGLQASGKSTFRRERFDATHAVVSKDLMPNNRRRAARQAELVEEHLAAGRSVMVDNTNPASEDRAPLVALARRHGARVVGYVFETSLSDALRRNALREGRQRVPDVGLYDVVKRLRPPTYEEGFDALYRVRLAEGEGFTVEPIPEDEDAPGSA
jgi:predicted kinase